MTETKLNLKGSTRETMTVLVQESGVAYSAVEKVLTALASQNEKAVTALLETVPTTVDDSEPAVSKDDHNTEASGAETSDKEVSNPSA